MVSSIQRRASTEELQELWGQYAASGEQRLRDRLALSLAPMVKYIASQQVRDAPDRWDVEELVSCGFDALLSAIDDYDPASGGTLERFAWPRVHGAIVAELRHIRRLASVEDAGIGPLDEIVEALSEQEKQVAVLLYIDNLTLVEISDRLGLPESRIRQIHGQLRRRLREILASPETLLAKVA